MNRFKSHFVFNRSERNGIFILVIFILLLQGVYFYVDFNSEAPLPKEQQEQVLRFQKQIDSLKRIAALEDSVKIYPFNPNFISDYRGYLLGMSIGEIDRLHAYRAGDHWIRTSEEFQEVTGISDSLLKVISPYFKFPRFERRNSVKSLEAEREVEVQDINIATAEDFKVINGIGEVLSKRIVKYRESIGGFVAEVQIYDVYGLSSEVGGRLLKQFKILNPLEIRKQDLNSISVLGLSEIPGFTYELARAVVEYREQRNGIGSFAELANIKNFPVDKIARFQLYLAIKN